MISFIKCLTIGILFCSLFSWVHATNQNINIGGATNNNTINQEYLDDINTSEDFSIWTEGAIGVRNTLYKIADSIKDILYIIATLYFIILVLKLILSSNTEEEIGNFKKGILWITIGLFITQIAFSFVKLFYDNGVSGWLAQNFIGDLINPLISILETLASAFFIAMAIFTFYRMVTANGEDDKVTKGKQSIIYALIGFIIVKLAKILVVTTYGKINCWSNIITTQCTKTADLSWFSLIIVDIINWMNSLIGIVIIIMIIYAGSQILLSNGEEEKVSKAKNIIIWVFIGILILSFNYLILTFFFLPESSI